MKLGILSDTHNNATNTREALALLHRRGAERLIHCGDITSPEIVRLFRGWQVDFVFGNIDADRGGLARAVGDVIRQGSINIEFHGQIAGVSVAAIHGDDSRRLKELIRAGRHAYIFRGHSHERSDLATGGTRVINPGALGGKRVEPRSVCLLDLATGVAEFLELPSSSENAE